MFNSFSGMLLATRGPHGHVIKSDMTFTKNFLVNVRLSFRTFSSLLLDMRCLMYNCNDPLPNTYSRFLRSRVWPTQEPLSSSQEPRLVLFESFPSSIKIALKDFETIINILVNHTYIANSTDLTKIARLNSFFPQESCFLILRRFSNWLLKHNRSKSSKDHKSFQNQ